MIPSACIPVVVEATEDITVGWKEYLGSDWFPVPDITLWIRKSNEEYSARINTHDPDTCRLSPEEFHTFFDAGERGEKEDGWSLYTSQVCFRAASVRKTMTMTQGGKEYKFPRGHFLVELKNGIYFPARRDWFHLVVSGRESITSSKSSVEVPFGGGGLGSNQFPAPLRSASYEANATDLVTGRRPSCPGVRYFLTKTIPKQEYTYAGEEPYQRDTTDQMIDKKIMKWRDLFGFKFEYKFSPAQC